MEGASERRTANGKEEDGPAERDSMTPGTLDTTILSFTSPDRDGPAMEEGSLSTGGLAAMEGASARRAANGREEDGPAERELMPPRTLDTTILSFLPPNRDGRATEEGF